MEGRLQALTRRSRSSDPRDEAPGEGDRNGKLTVALPHRGEANLGVSSGSPKLIRGVPRGDLPLGVVARAARACDAGFAPGVACRTLRPIHARPRCDCPRHRPCRTPPPARPWPPGRWRRDHVGHGPRPVPAARRRAVREAAGVPSVSAVDAAARGAHPRPPVRRPARADPALGGAAPLRRGRSAPHAGRAAGPRPTAQAGRGPLRFALLRRTARGARGGGAAGDAGRHHAPAPGNRTPAERRGQPSVARTGPGVADVRRDLRWAHDLGVPGVARIRALSRA